MKALLAVSLFVFSLPAFAGQSVSCREANKNGTVKQNGGAIKLNLEIRRNGSLNEKESTVQVKGFTRDRNGSFLSSMEIRSVNESKANAEKAYTTLFLDSLSGGAMLDIQLQFDARILGQEFRAVPANFVIGSEDANPDTGFAFGFDLVCSSSLN